MPDLEQAEQKWLQLKQDICVLCEESRHDHEAYRGWERNSMIALGIVVLFWLAYTIGMKHFDSYVKLIDLMVKPVLGGSAGYAGLFGVSAVMDRCLGSINKVELAALHPEPDFLKLYEAMLNLQCYREEFQEARRSVRELC